MRGDTGVGPGLWLIGGRGWLKGALWRQEYGVLGAGGGSKDHRYQDAADAGAVVAEECTKTTGQDVAAPGVPVD